MLSLVFVLGLVAIAAGFWLILPAAGLIVGGTLAAVVALLVQLSGGARP